MNRRVRHTVLLSLFVGVAAFLLLSLSLSDLDLQPGAPIPGAAEASNAIHAATPELMRVVSFAPVLEAILGIALIVLMVYVPARLMSLINPRKLLAMLVAIVLIVGLLSILPTVLMQFPTSSAATNSPDGATPEPSAPAAVSFGRPPSILIWLAAGCFLVGTGLVAGRLLKYAYRRNTAEEVLSRTAENALRDLGSGLEFSNVIIRCYLQMSRVLRSERKLERHHTMTAREFEGWLEEKGIPADAVHRLTALFEKARYGNQDVSLADQQMGRECLQQIVDYCRRGSLEGA